MNTILPASYSSVAWAPVRHVILNNASVIASVQKFHWLSLQKKTKEKQITFFSSLSDYGVDWSWVWEQCANQLRWRSQLPEVPPHFLHSKPIIPPYWGGLGLSLQSRSEGKIVRHLILHSKRRVCHTNVLVKSSSPTCFAPLYFWQSRFHVAPRASFILFF